MKTAMQIVELGEATTGETLHLFDHIAPTNWKNHGYLRRAIAEGLCETRTVKVDGQAGWLIAFHDSEDGGLWIDLVHTLTDGSGPAIEVLFQGMEALARERGRTYLRATVSRPGFLALGEKFGWKAEGVQMLKLLT